jgi:HEAT repeat protein
VIRILYSIVSAVLVVTPSIALSQNTPQAGSLKLNTAGEILREHNVELTESALVQALKSSDGLVRYLAAMELSEKKAVNATAPIQEALSVERIPRDRVNMALALGLLGDQTGPKELKRICADRNFVTEFRLYAVRYMFDLHLLNDEDCLSAIEEVLESKDAESSDRISALSLLPGFQNITEEQSQKLFKLTIKQLGNTEPGVRLEASRTLAALGRASAIPDLQRAMAKERDENIRSTLQSDLEKLAHASKE